jgi:hypothetical protein
MNLLSFAATGMAPSVSSGGGKGDMPQDRVEITIELDADKSPVANPDSACVNPGGEIVWKSAHEFDIILALLWSGELIGKRSKQAGPKGPWEVRVTAGSKNGRYRYGIAVGGKEVDPDVVIGPKGQQ